MQLPWVPAVAWTRSRSISPVSLPKPRKDPTESLCLDAVSTCSTVFSPCAAPRTSECGWQINRSKRHRRQGEISPSRGQSRSLPLNIRFTKPNRSSSDSAEDTLSPPAGSSSCPACGDTSRRVLCSRRYTQVQVATSLPQVSARYADQAKLALR